MSGVGKNIMYSPMTQHLNLGVAKLFRKLMILFGCRNAIASHKP